MNWQLTLFFSLLFLCNNLFAQDERFYRKIFTKKSHQSTELQSALENDEFKKIVSSSIYKIDLNRDGLEEGIILQKKDGNDYIKIIGQMGEQWLNYRLDTTGEHSKVYKISLKTLTPQSDVLIVHFYQGATQSTTFEATAKLYFISIDNRDLKTIKVFKGPHYWHEKEVGYKYWNRYYNINVFDYNKDGRNEISINFNKIARVYFYLGNGQWIKN